MSNLKFEEEGHKYYTDDDFQWVSVTKLVGQFKEPFNAPLVAEKCSKGKNPKYAGMNPKDILAMWDKENKRATDLGSWYHNERERQTIDCDTITRDGIELPIISPIMNGKVKEAPNQTLVEGIYPEHLCYLKSASVCGQVDRAEVVGDMLDIYDYKTSKEIKRRGYQFWDGSRKKMKAPLNHLEDCEFNHYALQLSIYMYIMLKYNYNLTPGKLQIHHIEFEIAEKDEFGFPTLAVDPTGEPIISKVNRIDLPYMKKEVVSMFRWLKQNKKMVLYED